MVAPIRSTIYTGKSPSEPKPALTRHTLVSKQPNDDGNGCRNQKDEEEVHALL